MTEYEYYESDGRGLTDSELLQRYDEYLYEVGEGSWPDYPYGYDRVLKECDPVAYRVGFTDWTDGELTDGVIFDYDPTAEEN